MTKANEEEISIPELIDWMVDICMGILISSGIKEES